MCSRLYQAITAAGFDAFVNPSRARPNQVAGMFDYGVTYYLIPRRIQEPRYDSDTPNRNVCFFTTGVAAYSHLYTPYVSVINAKIIEDRRIGIYPVEYEYQRGLSFLGTVGNKEVLRYSFIAGSLHFVSRTKGECISIGLAALRFNRFTSQSFLRGPVVACPEGTMGSSA